MQGTEVQNKLDNWRFERLYNNLFSNLVEQDSHGDKWRYDPLDSKYPTIDGILRRDHIEAGYCRPPEFALVQLKGTQFTKGKKPWNELKRAFAKKKTGKLSPAEQVTSIAQTCSAVLIGLSVDTQTERIVATYIGAPSDIPTGRQPDKRIEPEDLPKEIASVLDALCPAERKHVTRPVIFPRQKEIVYFNRGTDGTVSVGEDGRISGRNISINWTIPRGISAVSVGIISGRPEFWAEPVALPRPPYNPYPDRRETFTGSWQVKSHLPGIDDAHLWWILQVHFQSGAATVKVEARV